MDKKRITEKELILPSLFLMDIRNGITTSDLISGLTRLMVPTGEDMVILKTRKDTKFSQKVRNLVSHETLTKLGLASYRSIPGNGIFTITDQGKRYLSENMEAVEYLLSNNFSYDDIRGSFVKITSALEKGQKVMTFDENTEITEGTKSSRNIRLYERSRKLRDFAIRCYTKKGHIQCSVCLFDFRDFYGKIGEGFIEIHHIKPVFKYETEDKKIFLRRALLNVTPTCSNCHRMIHRNWKLPFSVEFLKNCIRDNGKFPGRI